MLSKSTILVYFKSNGSLLFQYDLNEATASNLIKCFKLEIIRNNIRPLCTSGKANIICKTSSYHTFLGLFKKRPVQNYYKKNVLTS